MQVLNVNYLSPDAPILFCKSLRETGFAVLHHHPLPTSLIEKVYGKWQSFFDTHAKHDYLYTREAQDGYFPFRSETAKGKKISDLKEFYHLYPWGRIPPEVKDSSLTMFHELQLLAEHLLEWIEDDLPHTVSQQLSMPLCKMIEESPKTLLRVLHYPPLSDDFEEEAERAAPHEDINLITLLPAATTPGLEVLDHHGNWHAVSCDPGNIVVNVGDMLQMCTRHYYKSTTHRVVNPKGELARTSRFSMPLFLHPRSDVRLSETHTAVEYLHERLRELGVY